MKTPVSAPGKRVVIVESPTKAKTLGPMLGAGYLVRASMGHVRDLPKDELGVDVEHAFHPTYHIVRQKAKTIKSLRQAVEGAGEIYLSTDPDREGEAIAWHLLQVLKPRDAVVRRVTFHEITPSAIQAAFAAPGGGLDMNLVNAQQARRVLDRLVGYQVSPLLWKTTKGKSAGRVQSVALRLVVDREREIRNFVPQEYWTIEAELAKQTDDRQPSSVVGRPSSFLARLVQIGDQPVGLGKAIELKTKADADRVIADLEGAAYQVKSVKRETKSRKPWPPFTTSTLQQSASARLGMSPAEAMKIAQELYEGIDIGEGKTTGLITYMRTDSTNVAPEAQASARQVVESTLGAKYLPDRPPVYKTKVKNAQEAHEAIRPTDVRRYPSALKPHLSDRQFRLYDLIWRRFVASQMAPALYKVTTVDVTAASPSWSVERGAESADASRSPLHAPRSYVFRATGRELLFDGFLRVWQEQEERQEDEDEGGPQTLPELTAGEALDLLRLFARQHFTQPPPRYTEAALIKALEERGIGRPSTYASIVGTLKDREYVVSEKRVLSPTPIGEATCDALVAAFPDMMDYGFTAQVEDWLDDVSRGEKTWTAALQDFYTPFARALNEAAAKMKAVAPPPRPIPQPEDGEPTQPLPRSAPGRRRNPKRASRTAGGSGQTSGRGAPATVDVACPKCGAPMVQRTSQYGDFLGCSKYPKCRGTRRLPGDAK